VRQPRFQVYEDQAGQYRWRLLAANGRTIADSGEAYTRKADAERAEKVAIQTVERIGHKAMIARIKAGTN
jgi:uncharacterized protein YegP (UPF0339 family)